MAAQPPLQQFKRIRTLPAAAIAEPMLTAPPQHSAAPSSPPATRHTILTIMVLLPFQSCVQKDRFKENMRRRGLTRPKNPNHQLNNKTQHIPKQKLRWIYPIPDLPKDRAQTVCCQRRARVERSTATRSQSRSGALRALRGVSPDRPKYATPSTAASPLRYLPSGACFEECIPECCLHTIRLFEVCQTDPYGKDLHPRRHVMQESHTYMKQKAP